MGELKSAWEIAQDKVDGLGSLSPEEKRKLQEEKYDQIGRALADKYLEKENTNYLLTKTQKYEGQDRQMVTHAVIERLVDRIDIKYSQTIKKINEGLQAISDIQATNIVNQIDELFKEYQQAEAEENQKIEKAGREILHGMRIAGTAIGKINIQANAEWKQSLEHLSLPYQERLNILKQALLAL